MKEIGIRQDNVPVRLNPTSLIKGRITIYRIDPHRIKTPR